MALAIVAYGRDMRVAILCHLVLLALLEIAASMAQAQENTKLVSAGVSRVPGEFIVVLDDASLPPGFQPADIAAELEEIAADHGIDPLKVWVDAVHAFFAEMTDEEAESVSMDARVLYVEENAELYLADATRQTNINPVTCDPTLSTPCSTVMDNRLWHLDRADQNYAAPDNKYSYSTDGTGVTVYVVDSGVNKNHNEFGPSGARVKLGYNASGDLMQANDPCLGFATPPLAAYSSNETAQYETELGYNGHGTAVASVLGGRRIGVANNVTIIPVKVIRCDRYSARTRLSGQLYQVNETMFVPQLPSGGIGRYYRATTAGVTAGTAPTFSTVEGAFTQDGQVKWVTLAATQNSATTQMLIDGLNWILKPENVQGPKSYAVVTLSTYRLATAPDVAGPTNTVEAAIRSLLASNLTVTASANNQNGNACDTSPARMSRDNPATAVASDVITVGGSMIVNRPWSVDLSDVAASGAVEADGGGVKGVEPAYDSTKPVREARWVCGAGDSEIVCSNPTPTSTVNPTSTNYAGYNAGSNGGPCVTLFAPAKNISVAATAAADSYRDPRIRGGHASGTSFSAPIAAGFAARLLQITPTLSPVQIRTAMIANSAPLLDPATLNPYDYLGTPLTGTPNRVLRLADVQITVQPQSTAAALTGTTSLSVSAGGVATLSYQWYEVNAGFDYATYKYGAHSSTLISGATSSTYQAPASTTRKAYWVRINSSRGSADSDIAVVVPRPQGAPANVSAVAAGSTVTVTWTAGIGAEKYEVQRKVAGQGWTRAALVANTTFALTETPAAPGGMVVYRVLSVAGDAYLPPTSLAASAPSNADLANLNSASYESLAVGPPYITMKAQHLLELRQAVNALCDAAGVATQFATSDLLLSAIQAKLVEDEDFTSLMTKANNVRTNAALGMAPASFVQAPAAGGVGYGSELQSLRNALN